MNSATLGQAPSAARGNRMETNHRQHQGRAIRSFKRRMAASQELIRCAQDFVPMLSHCLSPVALFLPSNPFGVLV